MMMLMRLNTKLCLILISLLVGSLFSSVFAQQETEIVWTGRPIDIQIPVGVERVVRFNNSSRIQVAYPTELWGIATAESSRGIVLLRTTRPFEDIRVRFRDKDNGKIYSFNVTAVEGDTDLSPISVVDNSVDGVDDSVVPGLVDDVESFEEEIPPELVAVDEPQLAPAQEQFQEPEPVDHGITTLVRFAMQNVYSPDRLIEELDDVFRISFDDAARDINVVPGVSVKSRVLGQWKNNDRYITAIYLQNMTSEQVLLDPRILTGRHYWDIAALMHSELTPANTFGDSTTLVAISDKKWVEYSQWLR